jgi:hypothetical protein
MFRVFDGRLGQQSFESSSCCLRKKVDAAMKQFFISVPDVANEKSGHQ